MGYLIRLAWRNIWRNKSRTRISAASLFFAIILVLFMRSMQLGTYDHIIQITARLSSGYMQVQAEGFWDKHSLDQSFLPERTLPSIIKGIRHVTQVTPRFESFGFASSGEHSRGVLVQGIVADTESQKTTLAAKLQEGSYLTPTSTGAMIGSGLAKNLSLRIGDSLVLLGEGYHGISVAVAIPVIGLLKFPLPELDQSAVYLSLPYAQRLYGAENRITALVIMVENAKFTQEVEQQISEKIPSGLVVKDWEELLPELVQSIQIDNAGGIIMLGILYMVVAFGVFGTSMMMTLERKREFAVLAAVGMRRWKMSAMVLLEILFLGFLGAFAGSIVSIPILWYFKHHPIPLTGQMAEAMIQYGFEPIMAFRFAPDLFVNQFGIVFLISLFSILYPIWNIGKFRIPESLRG